MLILYLWAISAKRIYERKLALAPSQGEPISSTVRNITITYDISSFLVKEKRKYFTLVSEQTLDLLPVLKLSSIAYRLREPLTCAHCDALTSSLIECVVSIETRYHEPNETMQIHTVRHMDIII